MKIKTTGNRITKRTIALLALAIVVVGIGLFIYIKNTQENTTLTPTDAQNKTEKVTENRTYEATSEGKTITVPDNVDPSSIKNYRLVTENETYKILELSGEYYVTLYPIINRPDQSNTYQDQLKEYKQSAIDYLKKSNINIQKTKIYYEPSEATDL